MTDHSLTLSYLSNLSDHLNTGGNPMNDEPKIEQVLIQELASLRERISELEEELRESEEKYRNIL
jgi:hypothetical protein